MPQLWTNCHKLVFITHLMVVDIIGRLDSDGESCTAWGDWTPGAPESIMDLARIDVIRNNGRTLQTFDFKLSRPRTL